MVGFQDSINLVKENLRNETYTTAAPSQDAVDHDAILRDYDSLMREHERRMAGHRRHVKRHGEDRERDRTRSKSPRRSPKPTSMRFRFKADSKSSSSSSSKRRKHRTRDYDDREREGDGERQSSHRHRTRTRSPEHPNAQKPDDANLSAYAAHPFARPRESEYLDPTAAESVSASPQPDAASPGQVPPAPAVDTAYNGPDTAFRASLFDAIADDEGAAYWEGVYGEPIHVYSRPSVRTEAGVLEQMGDDEYADYVKRKMWEKKKPELVKEREERARRELDEEQREKRKRRNGGKGQDEDEENESDFEWVGNEEKGYERRRVRGKPRPTQREGRNDKGRGFMSDVDAALARGAKRKEAKRWQQAWAAYKQKWEDLKNKTETLQGAQLANAIPWPVITGSSTTVERDNIEDFFRNYTLCEGETRTGLLKAERFRWHPDKIQHRFGGENVDADTLKLVTSVFQTIDEMMAEEKKREGRV